jgi:multidrug efflux system outer membrane protein
MLFSGCAIGPDYQRPAALGTNAMPAAFAGAANAANTGVWKLAEPSSHLPKGAWWEIFGDAELNRLETEAGDANQELKAAAARFEQARALVNIAKSGFWPRAGLSGSATRQRDSANRPLHSAEAIRASSYNDFVVPFDLSYEFDLWGRVRRSVEAARAAEQAQAGDIESVQLAIQAEVAADYFALRALDAESALLRTSLEVFQKSLALTRNRRAGGIATDLDVAQAETVLKTTEAQLPATALQRAKLEHALAVLIGQPASTFSLPERPLDFLPPIVPAGLPSELLERRPDIASAERRMAAANANIGAAKAAFFPSLRFNGLAGFQSVDAGTLFDWPSRFWAVGPSLTIPLFEGGKPRAKLRQAKAAYDATIAHYRQTVLTAVAEVEDNLAAQRLLASEHAAETAALRAAQKSLEIAGNRYRSGLVTYLEVATAQNSVLERERAAVRLRGQQLAVTVALVKSLGGGWQAPKAAALGGTGDPPVPSGDSPDGIERASGTHYNAAAPR